MPVQDPALAVNRVLVRAEWATALLETGDEQGARVQLQRVLAAADEAARVDLPWLWQRDVEACRVAAGLLAGDADAALLDRAAALREELAGAGDLETVPLLDAARALALHAQGRRDEARAVAGLVEQRSTSSGATSVLAWARARVLDPEGWRGEAGDYARLAAAERWQARTAVLVAARSFVALARLGADHERLTQDLSTDVLTGLANRRAFEQWLAAPPARGARAAVLLLDLDGFKQVNDRHGHGVGDDVLRAVGALVAEQVRPGDLAARLGGDELAVVLEDAGEPAARERATALRDAVLDHGWERLSPGLAVGVSVGVAVGPLDQDPGRLYRRADAALYAAKHHPDGVVVADRVVPSA